MSQKYFAKISRAKSDHQWKLKLYGKKIKASKPILVAYSDMKRPPYWLFNLRDEINMCHPDVKLWEIERMVNFKLSKLRKL